VLLITYPNRLSLFTVFFLLFTVCALRAQRIAIYDAETQMPITNVLVFNESESHIYSSDLKGWVNTDKFNKSEGLWFKHPAYELYFLPANKRNAKSVYLTPKFYTLDEFVISASRTNESKKNLPYMVQSLKPTSIEFKNAGNSADILSGTGHISVQKSQGGGGSPILRGFEANRILLVVDGVRMNNAIYRSGHLQNSITIDPNILERTEILFGPSSVMYGSDALGGVIHYRSKKPVLSYRHKPHITSEGSIRYSSATHTMRTSANVNAGFRKWASLTNISYGEFGDIIMGKNRPKNILPEDWGKMYHYSKLINGKDSMVVNPNPNQQLFTGYKQYDILQKFIYRPKWYSIFTLNTQYSTSSNISRFDQLNDYKGDELKFAEYYYGPQNRLFISANHDYNRKNLFFNSLQTLIAFQKVKESRHSRRFKNYDKLNQYENLNAYSANLDFIKKLKPGGILHYGFEFVYNKLRSTANFADIFTNELSFAPTRYPNGGSYSQSYAFYTDYKRKITQKIIFNGGFRFSYYQYNSVFNEDMFFSPLIKNLVHKNSAPSGSIGLVCNINKSWRVNTSYTSGFRVPNVDDYGKIRAKKELITMPNPDLNPEYAHNIEIATTKNFWDEKVIFNLSLFHTWLNNAIVRANYQYKGQDSIIYGDSKYRMITNINAQQARIKGISAEAVFQPNSKFGFKSTCNYTHGESSTNEPLGHISPIFGKAGINYRRHNLKTELYLQYQGTKYANDMSPYGEDNEDEGTMDGFPAWNTLNLATQYTLSKHFNIQLSIENIFDRHYKTFASGISAPGRNFIFSFTGRF
jgi:hemoglobin/transferrin/lactoferrin receptor protein